MITIAHAVEFLLEGNEVSVWLQKQLRPFSKLVESVPPEAFAYISLAFSGGAAFLIYCSQAQFCPLAILPAAIMLMFKSASDSVEETLCSVAAAERPVNYLAIRMCERLADLLPLMAFAFWDSLRIHLVLMAIVSMLLVSYIGEVSKNLGANIGSCGLLCRSHRDILLIFFCFVYLFKPNARLVNYSMFEVMFALFIPLASITLLQRMESAITHMHKTD